MLKKLILLPVAAVAFFVGILKADENTQVDGLFPFRGEVYDQREDYQVAVNLRSGDGINYKILRVLYEGQELVVNKARGDWYEVELPEGSTFPLWVKLDFLDINSNEGVCNADRVVLRAGATTQSAPLGSLDQGQTIEVLEVQNHWVKVRAPQGTRAWINARYVRYVGPIETQEDVQTAQLDPEPLVQVSEELETQQVVEEVEIEEEIQVLEQVAASESSEAIEEPQDDLEPQLSEVNEVSSEEEGRQASLEPEQDSQIEVEKSNEDLTKIRTLFEERLAGLRDERERELKTMDHLSSFQEFTANGFLVNLSEKKGTATHRLEMAQRLTYLLKAALDRESSPLLDLDKYSGKHVGVKGKIFENNEGVRLIEVKEVVILKDQY